MIKAVLFDVDGVLLDSFDANLDFFQNLLTQAGYQGPTREQYKALFYLPMCPISFHDYNTSCVVTTKSATPCSCQQNQIECQQ